MIPAMVNVLERCLENNNEESAAEIFEVFDTLLMLVSVIYLAWSILLFMDEYRIHLSYLHILSNWFVSSWAWVPTVISVNQCVSWLFPFWCGLPFSKWSLYGCEKEEYANRYDKIVSKTRSEVLNWLDFLLKDWCQLVLKKILMMLMKIRHHV